MPDAPTVSVSVAPAASDWLCGWFVMLTGAAQLTVSNASALIATPKALLTRAE